MGCDIHATIEVKRYPDSGWWGEVGDIQIDRWYELFAKLANVRNSIPETETIKEPRGFPKDASYEAREHYERWQDDAHTPSYLTLREILEGLPDKFLKENFIRIMKIFSEKYGWENIRLVFWFDN